MRKSKPDQPSHFWQKLKKPFFALAPMEDVTDTVFRQIVIRAAKPDVFFTEFTNVDGLMSPGKVKIINRLKFAPVEKPIVAQIWGLNPDNFFQAAKMITGMGFDALDINMGCPQRDVIKIGACAALMKDRKRAEDIIAAVRQGAEELSVSVKTRLGFHSFEPDWLQFLLDQKLDAITIHGRTVLEMSKPPARWEEIGRVVTMRNEAQSKTVIIGNGDIPNYEDGIAKYNKYGVDGLMIGRGIFENLWAFERNVNQGDDRRRQKIALATEHVKLFEQTWGTSKNPQILKKFFKIYVNGFEGANSLRATLMEAKDCAQMLSVLGSSS